MGLVQPVQSLNQIAWPEDKSGQRRAAFKSAPGHRRAFRPTGVETPEEALTYIQQLYQNGRTAELVSLLRGNPVFREAWQTLQQSSSSYSEATGARASSLPDPAPEPLPIPVLAPGQTAADQLPITRQARGGSPVKATQGSSPEIQRAQTNLVPSPRPSRTLAAGRQVYENQAFYYAQEKANFPRISIWI